MPEPETEFAKFSQKMNNLNDSRMDNPATSGQVSYKGFYLKAVASVTLDPNGKHLLCQ